MANAALTTACRRLVHAAPKSSLPIFPLSSQSAHRQLHSSPSPLLFPRKRTFQSINDQIDLDAEIARYDAASTGSTAEGEIDEQPATEAPSSKPGLFASRRQPAPAPRPWFLDAADAPSAADFAAGPPSSSPAAPPPSSLPAHLLPLHTFITSSPFIEPASVQFVDAKEAYRERSANLDDGKDVFGELEQMARLETSGDETISSGGGHGWTDWVVVATLRRGRERGFVPAVEAVADELRTILSKLPRPRPPIHVEGLPSSSGFESQGSWALIDAGSLMVHILTPEGAEKYDIVGNLLGTKTGEDEGERRSREEELEKEREEERQKRWQEVWNERMENDGERSRR